MFQESIFYIEFLFVCCMEYVCNMRYCIFEHTVYFKKKHEKRWHRNELYDPKEVSVSTVNCSYMTPDRAQQQTSCCKYWILEFCNEVLNDTECWLLFWIRARNINVYSDVYIQQDATSHGLFISGNCCTYFGWEINKLCIVATYWIYIRINVRCTDP